MCGNAQKKTTAKSDFTSRIQLQKKKSGVKNVWKFVPLRGGGRANPLMENAILNFHFDFLTTSLNINIKFNNIDNYNTINISCCVVIYEDTEENFSGNVCKFDVTPYEGFHKK